MITKLKEEHIKKVAEIHKRELSGFLPELGIEFLKLFYRSSMDIPEMFSFVEIDGSKVRGFISNITEAGGLYKKVIIRAPGQFLLLFLKYFITHPKKLAKFIKIFTYPGFSEGGAELLSIAIDRGERKKGIGRSLVVRSAEEFSKRGISKFKISVYDRLAANGFYRKIGCRLVSSFNFLSEKMNYYEYKIV
ncbi:hypothetical protein A2W14_00060 [Candidatus Gottesmanbacteria bacterium RBG_16_37_8]|uniref:N-acetyltransferase domain-containing protein n=1 Tax=Candidatus Gottesmanbacteria bacterium RBG_16_37_8 TaxID=1798371 RepID=A0A1F5YSZ3_9BACT|nr:MAG: hypothetical protein A2W14_00060 [Candidatus Gottesmanbacteria bacterium RBG_16_37_8]